jgi:hypothetical protein
MIILPCSSPADPAVRGFGRITLRLPKAPHLIRFPPDLQAIFVQKKMKVMTTNSTTRTGIEYLNM